MWRPDPGHERGSESTAERGLYWAPVTLFTGAGGNNSGNRGNKTCKKPFIHIGNNEVINSHIPAAEMRVSCGQGQGMPHPEATPHFFGEYAK